MAAAVIEFKITGTGFMFLFFFPVFFSLNVKLSHDATCVPSTCSDNDGHPERSSTIVPGEPTGQTFYQNLPPWLNIQQGGTLTKTVKGPENRYFSVSYFD